MDKQEELYKDLYIASENLRKYLIEETLKDKIMIEKLKKVLEDG